MSAVSTSAPTTAAPKTKAEKIKELTDITNKVLNANLTTVTDATGLATIKKALIDALLPRTDYLSTQDAQKMIDEVFFGVPPLPLVDSLAIIQFKIGKELDILVK